MGHVQYVKNICQNSQGRLNSKDPNKIHPKFDHIPHQKNNLKFHRAVEYHETLPSNMVNIKAKSHKGE